MSTSFRLPDLGEGVHEAEILAIPVEVGQTVKEGDVILEVETDKAAVEIPSPFTGTVSTIHVSKGDIVNVGDILVSFGDEHSRDEQRQGGNKPPVPAAPSTRRIARELGVDLHEVLPSGTKGLVTAEDVRNHAKAQEQDKQEKITKPSGEEKQSPMQTGAQTIIETPALPDFSQWGEIERQPFRSIRRATANRMAASWSQIPHVNCQDMADVTELEDFRQRHKEEIEKVGGRLTMTVFAMKAAATALKTYLQFNASLDLAAQEIVLKKYFHIGVAIDSDHGLVVPVIRDVDRKSIKEIAIELNGAIARARERKTGREEMAGGTFTITNAGAIGGGYFSAIINHPEVAILGMGQARMQPAVVTNQHGRHDIVPRMLMPIVLCFDHRVADGADAVRFQRLIIEALQDPDELLMTMT